MTDSVKNINLYLAGEYNNYILEDLAAWLLLSKEHSKENIKKIFKTLSPDNFIKLEEYMSNENLFVYLENFQYYDGALEELESLYKFPLINYLKKNQTIPSEILKEKYKDIEFDSLYHLLNNFPLEYLDNKDFDYNDLKKQQVINIIEESDNIELLKFFNVDLSMMEFMYNNKKLKIESYNEIFQHHIKYDENLFIESKLNYVALSKDIEINDKILSEIYDEIKNDENEEIINSFDDSKIKFKLNAEFISEDVLLKFTDSNFHFYFLDDLISTNKYTSVLQSFLGNNRSFDFDTFSLNKNYTNEQFDLLFDKFKRIKRNPYGNENFIFNILNNYSNNKYIYDKISEYIFEYNLIGSVGIHLFKSNFLTKEQFDIIFDYFLNNKHIHDFRIFTSAIENNIYTIPTHILDKRIEEYITPQLLIKAFFLSKINFIPDNVDYIEFLTTIKDKGSDLKKTLIDSFLKIFNQIDLLRYYLYIHDKSSLDILNNIKPINNNIKKNDSLYREIRIQNLDYIEISKIFAEESNKKIFDIIANTSNGKNIRLYFLTNNLNENNIEENITFIEENFKHFLNHPNKIDLILNYSINIKQDKILSEIYFNHKDILSSEQYSKIEKLNIKSISEYFNILNEMKDIDFDF